MVKKVSMKTNIHRKRLWLALGIIVIVIGFLTILSGITRSIELSMGSETRMPLPLYTTIGGIIEITLGLMVIDEKFRGKRISLSKGRKR